MELGLKGSTAFITGASCVISIAGSRGCDAESFLVMFPPINMATPGITKALANESGPQGIHVNVINPRLDGYRAVDGTCEQDCQGSRDLNGRSKKIPEP